MKAHLLGAPTNIMNSGASILPTITLPMNLAKTAQTLTEDFEDYTEWPATVGSFTVEDDAVNVHTGSHAVKVTGLAAGQNSIQKTVSWNFSSSNHFRIWVYASVALPVDGLVIYFSANDGFTKYWQWNVNADNNIVAGWNSFHALPGDMVATGGMTWNDTITRCRIRFNNDHGVNPTLTYDSIYTGGDFQPAILLEFDDGWDGVINHAYPSMQALHTRATASIVADFIGSAGYMTLANLQTLDAAGWAVINHTESHTYLNSQTEAQQEAAISACDTALATMSTPRRKHVTYPNGLWNADTYTALAALGMQTGRTIVEGNISLLPPAHNYELRIRQIYNTTSLATAKGYVDSVKTRSEVAIFLFHQLVVESPGGNEWTQANYDALVNYIVDQGVPIITRHDLYELQAGDVLIPNPAYEI